MLITISKNVQYTTNSPNDSNEVYLILGSSVPKSFKFKGISPERSAPYARIHLKHSWGDTFGASNTVLPTLDMIYVPPSERLKGTSKVLLTCIRNYMRKHKIPYIAFLNDNPDFWQHNKSDTVILLPEFGFEIGFLLSNPRIKVEV